MLPFCNSKITHSSPALGWRRAADIVADEIDFDSQSRQCLKITWGAFSKYKFPATLSPIDLESLRDEPQELIFILPVVLKLMKSRGI